MSPDARRIRGTRIETPFPPWRRTATWASVRECPRAGPAFLCARCYAGREWGRVATPDPPRVSLLHPHVDKYEDPASLDTLDFGCLIDPLEHGAQTTARLHNPLFDRITGHSVIRQHAEPLISSHDSGL